MHIRDYMNSLTPEQREIFANEAGTSVGYINLLSCGARKASPKMAQRLQAASIKLDGQWESGVVTLRELRPDIYDVPEMLCGRRKSITRRRKPRAEK